MAAVIATNSARPIAPVPRPQPHALAEGEDAIGVVLELVQPAVALRHLGGEDRLTWLRERQLFARSNPESCRTVKPP